MSKTQAAIEKRQEMIRTLTADTSHVGTSTRRQIEGQIAALMEEIAYIERSPEHNAEIQLEREIAAHRELRAKQVILQQRREERRARIEAEQRKYDSALSTWDWSLSGLAHLDDQRRVAYSHAEKLVARQNEAAVLSQADDDFVAEFAQGQGLSVDQVKQALAELVRRDTDTPIETRVVDSRTGKGYLIVTDPRDGGYTWVERNIAADAEVSTSGGVASSDGGE